ncbi:toprim domain-containing protein [Burkholderia cenocepacia]|uniref:toprim domain-containing protein n=1 Tax=Burkholderia cenocepacia TaxID=95486 RepID=UPI0024B6E32C|nr:toprim domain-containing protein [Burkholderia cenocepacia]MDI9686585.1 toprim domain-containing protein [Burkholderia cenocepacia]
MKHAQALPEGVTRKIPHDCGPGDALQINHKRDGWSAYCHRCKESYFVRREPESLAEKLERLERMRDAERVVRDDPSLPIPMNVDPRTWPLDARVWLYKAGISNAEIESLGFYWNERLQRVVMPVYDSLTGLPSYWQARTLDKTNPRKYLNPRVDKARLIVRYGQGNAIVLTEDMLSAYKVSRVGVAGWSILGTELNDFTASEVITACKPVYVWLDPDKAGQTAAAKIIRKLKAYGVRCTSVLSERDPKLLSKPDIIGILNEHRI